MKNIITKFDEFLNEGFFSSKKSDDKIVGEYDNIGVKFLKFLNDNENTLDVWGIDIASLHTYWKDSKIDVSNYNINKPKTKIIRIDIDQQKIDINKSLLTEIYNKMIEIYKTTETRRVQQMKQNTNNKFRKFLED